MSREYPRTLALYFPLWGLNFDSEGAGAVGRVMCCEPHWEEWLTLQKSDVWHASRQASAAPAEIPKAPCCLVCFAPLGELSSIEAAIETHGPRLLATTPDAVTVLRLYRSGWFLQPEQAMYVYYAPSLSGSLRRAPGPYRQAFVAFDAARVARFKPAQVARLLRNPGIVRNRLKINSTVGNAKAFLAVQHEFGSFDAYVWSFVGGTPRVNRRRALRQVPSQTPQSDALSRDLLGRGFKFVGSTICYAFMQAVGMVNDHTIDCFRYEQIAKIAEQGPLSNKRLQPPAAGATMGRRG